MCGCKPTFYTPFRSLLNRRHWALSNVAGYIQDWRRTSATGPILWSYLHQLRRIQIPRIPNIREMLHLRFRHLEPHPVSHLQLVIHSPPEEDPVTVRILAVRRILDLPFNAVTAIATVILNLPYLPNNRLIIPLAILCNHELPFLLSVHISNKLGHPPGKIRRPSADIMHPG